MPFTVAHTHVACLYMEVPPWEFKSPTFNPLTVKSAACYPDLGITEKDF